MLLFYSSWLQYCLESIFKLGFTEIMFMLKPEIDISYDNIGSSVFIRVDSLQAFFNNIFPILSILSFVFSWIASSIMLKEYSNKVGGTIKYWIIVSIPLIFYISQFFVQLNSQIIFH